MEVRDRDEGHKTCRNRMTLIWSVKMMKKKKMIKVVTEFMKNNYMA
jgi:hypothetical protein